DAKGIFEEAQNGTVFFDEIAELDLGVQAMLSRALERGEIQRVGTSQWIRVDTRVIASTQRNLDLEVQARRFRQHPFFPLSRGLIHLPPLRDRVGDVAVLARHFWRALGDHGRAFPDGLLARLEERRWPGNVRELQTVIARALTLDDLLADDPEPEERA